MNNRRRPFKREREGFVLAFDDDNYYYLRGNNLYKRLTDNGKTALDSKAAATLPSDDLTALIIAIHHFKGRSEVALNTLMVVLEEALKREPIEQTDRKSEYREYYKMANDELGYFLYMNEAENRTCDTCKYNEECPEEYKREQPNYCENWEQ